MHIMVMYITETTTSCGLIIQPDILYTLEKIYKYYKNYIPQIKVMTACSYNFHSLLAASSYSKSYRRQCTFHLTFHYLMVPVLHSFQSTVNSFLHTALVTTKYHKRLTDFFSHYDKIIVHIAKPPVSPEYTLHLLQNTSRPACKDRTD